MTVAQVVDALVKAGIPASEVLDVKQAQALARPKPKRVPAPMLDEHGAHIRKFFWNT
jgi:hypothetical protein